MGFGTKLLLINLYQCAKGFRTSERFLDNHYFLYVHSGKGAFQIGGTVYPAGRGDLFFCKAGIGNTIIADEQDPFLLSGIDFHAGDGKNAPLDRLLPRLNLMGEPFCAELIQRMVTVFKSASVYTEEICGRLLETLIYEVLRSAKLGMDTEENIRVKLLRLVESNYTKNLTYQELARITSYHKNSIHRILKSVTGMSLREYLISLRIKKAMELLLYSHYSIAAISALCGYNSAVFFSRQFKQKTGKQPSEIRGQTSAPRTGGAAGNQ